MRDPISIEELNRRVERYDLEAKRALGREGRGAFPESFFETYSAFANTEGGLFLLGATERPDHTLDIHGVEAPQQVLRDLWNGLNNRQRVSVNLLDEKDVELIPVDNKVLLVIHVPRAPRSQRPVFKGSNPMSGTYRRNHEGDFRCSEETVKRMLAEQIEDTRDARILVHYGMEDLDKTTFSKYRQRYQTRQMDHPWNGLTDQEFLRSIGGMGVDRSTHEEGLTMAGLLMFGTLRSIKEVLPYYMLDYQELDPRSNTRWVDRMTTDGTWSGNLYDFYLLVIQRLFRELRVPFQLRGDTRVDETLVHEALREAFVNTLIHADYSGETSILIVKRSDLFSFRNPGSMRVSVEDALHGGRSDCRNRKLQDMFRYVGLGEQAGSGLPKIQKAWREQHWRAPDLFSELVPYEQTIVTLRMVSLLPPEVVSELENRFGDHFRRASEIQKLALVTARIEGKVSHGRLRAMSAVHTRDITVALSTLVQKGLLQSAGAHKQTYYFLTGESATAETVPSSSEHKGLSSEHKAPSSEHKAPSSEHNELSSEHNELSSEHNELSSEHNESEMSPDLRLAEKLRKTKRASRKQVEETLLALCQHRYRSLPELAQLTGRSAATLRVHYIAHLVVLNLLRLRYPNHPTHPRQAYTSENTSGESR